MDNMTPAQEQIKELASIIDEHQIGCNLPKECNSECEYCAAEAIYELGYRKPPKDRPPLLGEEQISKSWIPLNQIREPRDLVFIEGKAIAQAQREADIKHYEED